MESTCTSPIGSRVTFPPLPTVPLESIAPVVMEISASTNTVPPVSPEVLRFPSTIAPSVLVRLTACPDAVTLPVVRLLRAVRLTLPPLLISAIVMASSALRAIVPAVDPRVVKVPVTLILPLVLLMVMGWPVVVIAPAVIPSVAWRLTALEELMVPKPKRFSSVPVIVTSPAPERLPPIVTSSPRLTKSKPLPVNKLPASNTPLPKVKVSLALPVVIFSMPINCPKRSLMVPLFSPIRTTFKPSLLPTNRSFPAPATIVPLRLAPSLKVKVSF